MPITRNLPGSTSAKANPTDKFCRLGSILVWLVYAGTLVLSACSSPPPLVAMLFDPVVHKPLQPHPRRPPYERPAPPPEVDVRPEAPQTDWQARLQLLPKDAIGATDWVRAQNENLITPKVGLDDKAEAQPVLDLDVELIPAGAPEFKAMFAHKTHTAELACGNCHTGIFQMEKGADAITMEKIFAGEYCGRCHGKVAFDVATGCARCHPAMPQ